MFFAHVAVPEEVLVERLTAADRPLHAAVLLTSQLATLEPLQDDEPGITVSGTGETVAEAIVDAIAAAPPISPCAGSGGRWPARRSP